MAEADETSARAQPRGLAGGAVQRNRRRLHPQQGSEALAQQHTTDGIAAADRRSQTLAPVLLLGTQAGTPGHGVRLQAGHRQQPKARPIALRLIQSSP